MPGPGRPSARPSDEQLGFLSAVIGRRRIADALGASHRTVERWCQDAQARTPSAFDREGHPTAAAMISAVETHYRTLAERVPELVDAILNKAIKILESEVIEPKTANEQLLILMDCLTSGRLVPVPTANAAGEITDDTRSELLARVGLACASAVQQSQEH